MPASASSSDSQRRSRASIGAPTSPRTSRPTGPRGQTEDYVRLAMTEFTTYRLKIDGLVLRPQEFSLDQIRNMPSRTQITRHDCVEGWSAIGEWTGVPLSLLIGQVGLQTDARYLVFHCADDLAGQGLYYESI